MNSKLLFVEGVSNTGKTTLCKHMQRKFGTVALYEGIRYLEDEKGQPRSEFMIVPKTIAEERVNQDMLFHAEIIRLRSAIAYMREGYKVVLDKSAVAILATAYAFEKTPERFGDLVYAMQGLSAVRDFILAECPSVDIRFAVIKTPYEERKSRNESRHSFLEDVWIDDDITKLQESFTVAWLKMSGLKWRAFDGTSRHLMEEVYEFYEEE